MKKVASMLRVTQKGVLFLIYSQIHAGTRGSRTMRCIKFCLLNTVTELLQENYMHYMC